MPYIYRHIRLDKNEPFYIGIGSDDKYKRAYSVNPRTKHWKNITALTPYQVEIVLDNLTWEEACKKEQEFIQLYGRKDKGLGSLCNYTDGGEGAYGRVLTNESKKKISQSVSGKNHGMYQKTHTEKAKEKIAKAGCKQVINIVTKTVYSSVKEAAAILGLRPNTLSRKLAGIRVNDTGLKYLDNENI